MLNNIKNAYENILANKPTQGYVMWRSPSNIALVKYWGKKGDQIPANASLSLGLSDCFTETEISYELMKDLPKKTTKTQIDFFFEGFAAPVFEIKVKKYIKKLYDVLPVLRQLRLEISTSNSFPHSVGIASSASSMSSIALGLLDIASRLTRKSYKYDNEFFTQASNIARIGSGSAARSLFEGYVSWGKNSYVEDSSDLYASKIQDDFKIDYTELGHFVIIVDKNPKKNSSSTGHELMRTNPYANIRYNQAQKNFYSLLAAFKEGNCKSMMHIIESEAMALHAMIATSKPYQLLINSDTISVIQKIINVRERKKLDLFFTLDAGPNIHLFYFKKDCDKLAKEIMQISSEYDIIHNELGMGPCKLE